MKKLFFTLTLLTLVLPMAAQISVSPSDEQSGKLLMEAFQAVEAQEYDTAIELALEGLKHTTNSQLRSYLYSELASAYHDSGEKTKAVEAAYKGLAEDYTNSILQYNLEVFLYELEQYDNAERAFLQLLELNKRTPVDKQWLCGAYAYMGLIQQKRGQYLPAEDSFKKAIDLAPNKYSVQMQGAYNGLGDACFEQKKYQEAIEPYEVAASLQVDNLNGRHYKLAVCYFNTGNTDKAIENFKKYIEIFNSNLETLLLASEDEEEKKILAEMDIDATELVAMCIDTYRYLGMIYYGKRDYASATSYANTFMLNGSDDGGVNKKLLGYSSLTDFLWLIDLYLNRNKDTETGQALFEVGMENYPDNPDILFIKAISDGDGAAEEDVEIYKEIIRQEQTYSPIQFDYATAYNNLAWAYYNLGQAEAGLPYAEKSVRMNAKHDYSWDTLGRIYYDLGRYEDCITAMTKCAAIPNCSTLQIAYEYIGNSYNKLGNEDEGSQWLEKAKMPVASTSEQTSQQSDSPLVSGMINGYEYVDLGLSVKWAVFNIGANAPWEYGDYYAWGETQTKSSYTESNSVTYKKKISDIAGWVDYDAACANWGGSWRLPTADEIDELVKKCKWEGGVWHDHSGYMVTGPNGNCLFLPTAGYRSGTELNKVGEFGDYWTSTPYEGDSQNAYYLYFNIESYCKDWHDPRITGQTIRPVSD
ncbi:MAG: tetratricopeptide repeat protein [Prevotellaceae bacterium]|nr:tetratricopeptide repeat protein [Prevotellaceae bacterium]